MSGNDTVFILDYNSSLSYDFEFIFSLYSSWILWFTMNSFLVNDRLLAEKKPLLGIPNSYCIDTNDFLDIGPILDAVENSLFT